MAIFAHYSIRRSFDVRNLGFLVLERMPATQGTQNLQGIPATQARTQVGDDIPEGTIWTLEIPVKRWNLPHYFGTISLFVSPGSFIPHVLALQNNIASRASWVMTPMQPSPYAEHPANQPSEVLTNHEFEDRCCDEGATPLMELICTDAD